MLIGPSRGFVRQRLCCNAMMPGRNTDNAMRSGRENSIEDKMRKWSLA
jgi:hypothetical protein